MQDEQRRFEVGQKKLGEASHHITINLPVRVLEEADKADYELIHLVGFQRGFESLIVAVYGDTGNGNESDAADAAVEYLEENFPESLTQEERENHLASWVWTMKNPLKCAVDEVGAAAEPTTGIKI
jgi:hypothetical protein